MPFAAHGWALERVLEARTCDYTPERGGFTNRCFDKGLPKNELRAIAESFGWLRFAIGRILSEFAVGGTRPSHVHGLNCVATTWVVIT